MVIDKLIRLSYWERIQGVLPEAFHVLLPPKPEPKLAGQDQDDVAKQIEKQVRHKDV